MDREAAIRASFAEQAYWCARLGSPFTASLCRLLGETLDRESAVGVRALDWPGDPAPGADALALRLCGALHALVRRGEAPLLAPLYPPAAAPEPAALAAALSATLARDGAALAAWLDRAPQTNEVGRSAVLMAGLMEIAGRFGQPIALYELGASAGLNLQLDRYAYDLGGRRVGDLGAIVRIEPDWRGPPPADAIVRIAERRGVDLGPLDPRRDRDRMLAYIWPDQPRRLGQAEAALAIAARNPPPVEAGDAADWIERRLDRCGPAGVTRVVMHSVAYQYFPAGTQARLARHIARAGASASLDSPLAWLRFEKLSEDDSYSLRLRTWPGDERLLAWAHPHASQVRWLIGQQA
jgi:hypothetical protein